MSIAEGRGCCPAAEFIMKRLYYASFLPGLEKPVEQMLKKTGGVSIERMLPGGALFRCNRTPDLPFIRQCFLVLFQMKPFAKPDEALRRLLTAGEWLNAFPYEENTRRRFRITVSDGEKKIPAGMRYIAFLERAVEEHTGLHADRERPEIELWLMLRPEASYFLMRIPVERQDQKGRLRPEVAGTLALEMGYDPGTVALLGTTDPGLIGMLRNQGAKRIFCAPARGDEGTAFKQAGIRILDGTPEQTGLEEQTCEGVCLFLPARKGAPPAFDLRASLFESARILSRQGVLLLIAPEQEALSIAERNRSLRIERQYSCDWGGNRMQIIRMRHAIPEE